MQQGTLNLTIVSARLKTSQDKKNYRAKIQEIKAESEWNFYIVIKKLKQPEYNENIPIYGIIRKISNRNTIINIININNIAL